MKEALAGGVQEPGGEGRGREGAGPELGAGPGAAVVAGAETRGAGRSGSGHPLRVPWRGGFGFGSTGRDSGRERDFRASWPRWTRGDPQLILSAPAFRWSPRDPRAGRELRRRPQHHEAVVGRAAAWRPALRTR